MFYNIIFFARTCNPDFGGMESHQIAMTQYCPIQVYADDGYQVRDYDRRLHSEDLSHFMDIIGIMVRKYNIKVFFFNDLGFIANIDELKTKFSYIRFILRSGGNDLYRAPIMDDSIDLTIRQQHICNVISRSIDTLIVNSDYSYLRSVSLGIPPQLMKKIRGGTSRLLVYKTQNRNWTNARMFREAYDVGNKILLVFACRMKKFKGILEFLETFSTYPDKASFFLVFAGVGEQLPLIQSAVRRYKLDSLCVFLGKLSYEDSLRMISYADYLVNPSIEEYRIYGDKSYVHTETMGRSMMEALSMHVPIISSNVGGSREIFYECENAGYIINEPFGIHEIFDRILRSSEKKKPMVCDYSWDAVFRKYRLLINHSRKHVLVLDLDDTILRKGDGYTEIEHMLKLKRDQFYLIINTARDFDDSLKDISDSLNADYCIAHNGSYIYTKNPTRWNDMDFLYGQIIEETEGIYQKLYSAFVDCKVKKTQKHIIQIRFDDEISTNDLLILDQILVGSMFEYIHSSHLMKVCPKYVNKGAALLFVLKDLLFDKVYGAGNSLNDCLFLRYVDYAWLSDDLSGVVFTDKKVNYFKKNDVGINLLSEILNKMQ